jgi:ABC-type sulfate/molybdate transport systems ATPase subunit
MSSSYSYSYGNVLLNVKDVFLQYDDKVILRGVNAEIRDIIRPGMTQGQVVGFLGPSGVGKTQLFRIIAGLNKPTSGAVFINSDTESVRAGEVGVVAQNYPLFEHRTVLGNLLLAASKKIKNHKEAREKAEGLLERFGFWRRSFSTLPRSPADNGSVSPLSSNSFVLSTLS